MCGVPDFNALMLMGSRLIYFGGALISAALIYKYYPIIKKCFNNFNINSTRYVKESKLLAKYNNTEWKN